MSFYEFSEQQEPGSASGAISITIHIQTFEEIKCILTFQVDPFNTLK